MHNALAFQRVHQPKGHVIAHYHPKSNMAYAYNPKGPLFTRMGNVLSAAEDPLGEDGRRGQRLWLLPEEVLYLLERGTIDVRWPATAEEAADRELGLPMSLQCGYAMFIGDSDAHDGALTFERYSVYTALKRQGYIVLRAPSWNGPGRPIGKECFPPLQRRTVDVGLLHPSRWWQALFGKPAYGADRSGDGSLVAPGVYREYADIYRRLALIDFHDTSVDKLGSEDILPATDPAFRITYHVYKPNNTTFKKSAPGPPDFRIAVVDGRNTSVPTLDQLSSLLDTVPYTPPKENAHFYAKLKNGHKNVILAVVDQGITSYLRLTDSVFGKEKIYERIGQGPGAKRGGRGGGRGGRGGGRGRGR